MMSKNIFLLLATAALLTFAGCSGDEETRYPTPKSEKITWKVDVRSQTGESINTDNEDKEDQVDNVILAGSTHTATLTGKSFAGGGGANTAVFSIESFLGKKDFFFAANFNDADAARLGVSGLESDFNKLEFNTQDYIRGFFGNDDKKPIPMSAALRDVEAPTGVSGLTSLSQSEVRLERLFARVDVDASSAMSGKNATFSSPYDIEITGIRVRNVPAKFSVGGALVNYDLKNKSQAADYAYLDLELPLTSATPDAANFKKTHKRMSFYIPENYVSHPVFHSADLNGMTYLEITYTAKWSTDPAIKAAAIAAGFPEPENGKCYYRIGDAQRGSTQYGQVRRNTVYRCVFKVGETFDQGNPAVNKERVRLNERVLN